MSRTPRRAGGPVSRYEHPAVLTWQIGVTDIDSAIQRCRSEGISFGIEHNNPAPRWTCRRLLIGTPSGYRLALEGPNE